MYWQKENHYVLYIKTNNKKWQWVWLKVVILNTTANFFVLSWYILTLEWDECYVFCQWEDEKQKKKKMKSKNETAYQISKLN